MWSGTLDESSPTGYSNWKLCDGTTYDSITTPDLRGRFIIGYTSTESEYDTIGKTGGEERVSLDIAEIPSHNHDIIIHDPGHLHQYTSYKQEGSGKGVEEKADDDERFDKNTKPSYTGISGTSMQTGGENSHENRPPYYVLAYIMRIT